MGHLRRMKQAVKHKKLIGTERPVLWYSKQLCLVFYHSPLFPFRRSNICVLISRLKGLTSVPIPVVNIQTHMPNDLQRVPQPKVTAMLNYIRVLTVVLGFQALPLGVIDLRVVFL